MTWPPATPPGRDERAALAALASLRALGPRRLRVMLGHHPPVELWLRVRDGRRLVPAAVEGMRPGTVGLLAAQAAGVEPDRLVDRCDEIGAVVAVPGDAEFPAILVADRDPPPVLFVLGDHHQVRRRRVGVVGTRNATASGRATAFELGEELARSGVAVVSGLARGIDGAAHRGVRSVGGPAIGVVGSGIDVPYPKQHRDLWAWIVADGLLLSEWPPGVVPDAWHFPLRNRILAALSEVLVVVESRARGGSLITAKAAADRGVTVMAVPGSPRSRSADGTNRLLFEEAATGVVSVDDVLVALGLDTSRAGGAVPVHFGERAVRRPPHQPHTLEAQVFALCADRPCTLDDLVVELAVPVMAAAMAAARLERDGWLVDTAGWFEIAGSKLGAP